MRAVMTAAALRGDFQNAKNIENRLAGFWNAELREAIEEVCGDDSEALEVLQKRFVKWQETGERKSAQSLHSFLDGVRDPLLVSVARECLRRRKDVDYCWDVEFDSAEASVKRTE